MIAGSCAAVCLQYSYAGASLLCGGLTVFAGCAWVAGLIRAGRAGPQGMEAPWLMALGGLLLAGTYFAELPSSSGLACLLIPLPMLLAGRGGRFRWLGLGLCLALAGVAWWLALPEPNAYDSYY